MRASTASVVVGPVAAPGTLTVVASSAERKAAAEMSEALFAAVTQRSSVTQLGPVDSGSSTTLDAQVEAWASSRYVDCLSQKLLAGRESFARTRKAGALKSETAVAMPSRRKRFATPVAPLAPRFHHFAAVASTSAVVAADVEARMTVKGDEFPRFPRARHSTVPI